MNTELLELYRKERARGWSARLSLRTARIEHLFAALQDVGLVDLQTSENEEFWQNFRRHTCRRRWQKKFWMRQYKDLKRCGVRLITVTANLPTPIVYVEHLLTADMDLWSISGLMEQAINAIKLTTETQNLLTVVMQQGDGWFACAELRRYGNGFELMLKNWLGDAPVRYIDRLEIVVNRLQHWIHNREHAGFTRMTEKGKNENSLSEGASHPGAAL